MVEEIMEFKREKKKDSPVDNGIKPLTSLTAMVGIVSTLAAIVTGYSECSRKETEVRLAKINAVKELLPSLSDTNSEKRRYAFSTLLILYSSNKNEEEKENLISFGETALSLQDAEALEALAYKLKTFQIHNEIEKEKISKFMESASRIYGLRARNARYEAAAIGNEIDQLQDGNENKNLMEKKQKLLFQEARNYSEKAVELNPKDTRSLYELGRLVQENGEIENAIDKFEKIIEIYNLKQEFEKKDEQYRRSSLNLAILYKQLSENSNRKEEKKLFLEKAQKYFKTATGLFNKFETDYLKNPTNEPEFNAVGIWLMNKTGN